MKARACLKRIIVLVSVTVLSLQEIIHGKESKKVFLSF